MDFLATKGLEYLLSLGYLLLLIPFWWLLRRVDPAPAKQSPVRFGWFRLPDGLQLHRGHAWVRPEADDIYTVGIDDFARHLLGEPSELGLPKVGDTLEQGEIGWRLGVDGHEIPMLAPLPGEVVARNDAALRSPALVSSDPYGDGWLLRLRKPRTDAPLSSLLPTGLARAWMEQISAALSRAAGPEPGPVLQDAGPPLFGFARELGGADWPGFAARWLLTPPSPGSSKEPAPPPGHDIAKPC